MGDKLERHHGYEISYKKEGDDATYIVIQEGDSREDALKRFIEKHEFEEIVDCFLIYEDIRKEFYEIGDRRGWD